VLAILHRGAKRAILTRVKGSKRGYFFLHKGVLRTPLRGCVDFDPFLDEKNNIDTPWSNEQKVTFFVKL